MGRGRSPVWFKDPPLDYLLVRRQVKDGAASHFLTVLDAYEKTPVVERVRVLEEAPIVLEVTRPDGVDDITIRLPAGPSRTTAHRPIGVRVRSRKGNRPRDVRIGELPDGVGPGYATATILDVDYDAHRILVAGPPGREQDFTRERAVRIYNEMRSALFRVVSAEPKGGRFAITLDKTALVARFPITDVVKDRLKLGVKTPFITGHVDEKTGALTDGPNDWYHGCRIGEGNAARRVAGISNTSPAWLQLVRTEDAPTAMKDAVGKVLSVWHYGVGDAVEAVRIEE